MDGSDDAGFATGAEIYPIERLLIEPGIHILDLLLCPGEEADWETGIWNATDSEFYRRDNVGPLRPTHFSAMPGKRVRLKPLGNGA